MTSANVTIYVICKGDKIVGEHSQHSCCNAHWEKLLKYQPLADHTIQWTWRDEEEALHEEEPLPLVDFLEKFVKACEDIELRFPKLKAKREKAGLLPPRQRYLGYPEGTIPENDPKRVIA